MDPSPFTPPCDTGQRLLALARSSIAHALGGPAPDVPTGDAYDKPAATFVTVMLHGVVHGCIGALEPRRKLAEDVEHNAVAAALSDPRSRPLTAEELGEARIEISILSALETVEVTSEEDAANKIVPGVDGIVLSFHHARATFLPQVWDKLPSPKKFLTELKRKAGLSYWPDQIRVERYTVQKYAEPAPMRKAPLASYDDE
jgi:AmmeMemoRadiSam system protein A